MSDQKPNGVTFWVAMAGAQFQEVPEKGAKLKELPGFDEGLMYLANGQQLSADSIVRPGDQISVSQRHTNGA